MEDLRRLLVADGRRQIEMIIVHETRDRPLLYDEGESDGKHVIR